MSPHQVIQHFGSIQKTADTLGVTFQAVHKWTRTEKVPAGRQWQIQSLTAGRLTVDEGFHPATTTA